MAAMNDEQALTGSELNQALANAVVAHHRTCFGRGPSNIQAFHRHNVVVLVMSDTLTRGERTLVAGGAEGTARLMRQQLGETMRPALITTIEQLTGCGVDAFMSGTDMGSDLAAVVVVLDQSVTASSQP
jgi:uncharacterized protein YbcI